MAKSTIPPNFGQSLNNDLINAVNDLYNWEKQIKLEEKLLLGEAKDTNNDKEFKFESFNENEDLLIQENDFPKNMNKELSYETVEPKNIEIIAEELKSQGNKHVEASLFKKAIDYYTEAISYNNLNSTLYANRALCYFKLKDFENCIEDCNRAIEINPEYIKAYYRKAQALESLKRFNEAYIECMTVLDYDPSNSEALTMKARLNKLTDFEEIPESHLKVRDKPTNFIEIKVGKLTKPTFKIKSNISKQIKCKKIEKIKKTSEAVKETQPTTNSNEKLESKKSLESMLQEVTTKVKPEEKKKGALTTTEFYVKWKEIPNCEKFNFLKKIELQQVNKLLGSRLDSTILSDILLVLNNNCNEDIIFTQDLLFNLMKHFRMHLLKMFFSIEDIQELMKIINSLEENVNTDKEIIDSIKNYYL